MSQSADLTFSPLDSERFGLRVFRGRFEDKSEKPLLRTLSEHCADVAIIRVPAGQADAINRLTRFGMRVMHADTLVYYEVSLEKYQPQPLRNQDLQFSTATSADMDELTSLVQSTFSGYVSHYHSNPLFEKDAILSGYVEWAVGHISPKDAGRTTWVARRDGQIVAFACCSLDREEHSSEGILYGVHPDHAGGGLYGDLIRFTQARHKEAGSATMRVSTQIWNYAVQKVWSREGFVLKKALDTYHVNALLSTGRPMVKQTLTFDRQQVSQFAEITGDNNPIHLDSAAAKAAGFDDRITHGMLAGGTLSRIFGTQTPGAGTLFLRSDMVFMHPIYSDVEHALEIRYIGAESLTGHVLAVATIRDATGRICFIAYSDLLVKSD